MQYRTWLGVSIILVACGAPPPDLPNSEQSDATLVLEAPNEDGLAERVVRLRVDVSRGEAPLPAALGLFEGELSESQLRAFRKGEIPATLAARKVPALIWRAEDRRSSFVAPSVELDAGQSYSLVSRSSGKIGSFTVDEQDALPLVSRVWPPVDAPNQATYVAFCGASGLEFPPTQASFEPGHLNADWRPGVDTAGLFADRCIHAELSAPSSHALVPPARLFDVLLDPSPLEMSASVPFDVLECTSDEVAVGPGCANVSDDRIVIRTPNEPLFWVLHSENEAIAEPVAATGSLTLRGFSPGKHATITGHAITRFGERIAVDVVVETKPAKPHLVLNEVLADPLGVEPAQEWVELYNDGAQSELLSNYVLEDATTKIELPAITLHPSEYALIVGKDFSAESSTDHAPVPGTKLVRVPKIGNGLSNSGEALRLVAKGGGIVSEFPALPKPKAGVSVARRFPWQTSGASNFGLHGGEGSSPGAANELLD